MSRNHSPQHQSPLAAKALRFLLAVALMAKGGFASAGPFAYVTVPGTTTSGIASIDTATRSLVGPPIDLIQHPQAIWALTVAPSGQQLYVLTRDYRTPFGGEKGYLRIIDTLTRSVVGSLELLYDPARVAASPDGRTLYVTHNYGPLMVIDAATATKTSELSGIRGPGVVAARDGRRFFVTDSTEPGAILVFDARSNALLQRIPVTRYPNEIDISPDDRYVYVTHGLDDIVSVVDTEANAVLKTLPFRAGDVAASPDGARVYFTSATNNSVAVLDTNSNTLISSVSLALGPWGVGVTPDSRSVYVPNIPSSGDSGVSVIDAASLTVTKINGASGSFRGRFIGPSPTAAALENPQPGSFQSGIGLISGWACGGPVAVSFDGAGPIPVPQGSPRGDTLAECGPVSTRAGFGLLTNFNLLGAGSHSAQLWLSGAPLGGPVSFTVTPPAGEFLRGASKVTLVNDFPAPGKNTTLVWQEAQQNFAIKAVSP